MKKITFLLSCILASSMIQAQETEYNHWSIEAGVNMSEPGTGYSEDGATALYNSSLTGSIGGELGVRYMINEKFGFKLGGMYSQITEGDNSLPFETTYYRANLEGVVNVGSILGFREWTQRFNLLGHAGAGVANIKLGEDVTFADEDDFSAMLMVGITPQIRISDHIAFYADMTLSGNLSQTYTWDGNRADNGDRYFDGNIATFSAGIQIYLGKKEKHADWVDMTTRKELTQEIDSLSNRIAEIETNMIDSDQDGVPNYLDREPNTMNGVATDTKGVAVDKNNNGVPDEIEGSLDKRYAKANSTNGAANAGLNVKTLINEGYVNVYFEFNSTKPETYSYEAINYLVKYMNNNPSAQAELIGYADEIGNATYNMQLSEKRAKKVHDILVASGVSEDRLEHRGEGIDDSVDKSSKEARQLVRRVTFRLK
ncbi:OmpA family protein [Mesonia sp. K4-1]|uniref:OmpA family protein n=1 Tax=Mesonia sp. K4-1 TaxID=2602760 RepID=UPI0011C81C2B|nr:OmpA family protein [Mesonia sp. K4-1]TXK75492.1 OmpA family protein [Mesonia sp. K4-1]TXK75583.1 OmpA family protein [Mesonia sp. K4-1]